MPSIVTTSALGLAAAFAILAIWLALPAPFKKRGGKVGIWGPWILIFGGPLLGALWLYVDYSHVKTNEVAASIVNHNQIPPEEAPLPSNAKFRYKGKIFWVINRPYTKGETADIRAAFREVYDCINTHSEPIIANYDGPAPMFTREWISIIEKQGTASAIQKLTEIRTKVRFASTELNNAVNRRPYFRDEIRGMIDDQGEGGVMNGSLNDYIDALKSVPPGASRQFIKLAVGNAETKFEDAIKIYSGWIGKFNNKMMVAKDDLDRLMTIE